MNKVIKGAAGLGVSALFVWLTLKGKDLGAIWEAIARVDKRYLLGYFGLCCVVHLCRTVRWGILVEPLDPTISFKRLNAVSAVGFMWLITLPFRLGEVARPMLLRDGKKITATNALASVVVERVVDGLAMTAMLLVTLLFVKGDGPELQRVRVGGWFFFALFGGGGLFLVFAAWQHALAVKLVHAVGDRISPAISAKAEGLIDAFIAGLKAVPSKGKLALFVLLTVIYWGINGAGLGLLAMGFGLPLSALAMYTVLAVLTVGVMIPAGPGMAGIFQYFTSLGLSLFLPAAMVAVSGAAFANVLWAIQFGQQILFGLLFMSLGHLAVGEKVAAEPVVEVFPQ